MFRFMKRITLAASVISLLSLPAMAEETLIFATTKPPLIPINAKFLHPWAERINAEGEGILRIEVRDGPTIANHLNYYDRVQQNVIQIAWGLLTSVGSQYPRSMVSTLPYLFDDSENGSKAFWMLYEDGVLDDEMSDIVPLMLTVLPQSSIHFANPVDDVSNLAGKRIAAPSPGSVAITQALGGSPMSFTVTELYEVLQRGTVDGTFMSFTAFQPFRLGEVTSQHVLAPLGGAPGMVFMTRSRFEALSPEAQQLLMKHSGLEASRAFGRFWDEEETAGRERVAATDGHDIISLDAEDDARWAELLAPVTDAWAERTPDGFDVLEAYREALGRDD